MFKTAVVNEPSVLEPLKVYCMYVGFHLILALTLYIFSLFLLIQKLKSLTLENPRGQSEHLDQPAHLTQFSDRQF